MSCAHSAGDRCFISAGCLKVRLPFARMLDAESRQCDRLAKVVLRTAQLDRPQIPKADIFRSAPAEKKISSTPPRTSHTMLADLIGGGVMDWKLAMREERAALKRIVALLFALAALAEFCPRPVRACPSICHLGSAPGRDRGAGFCRGLSRYAAGCDVVQPSRRGSCRGHASRPEFSQYCQGTGSPGEVCFCRSGRHRASRTWGAGRSPEARRGWSFERAAPVRFQGFCPSHGARNRPTRHVLLITIGSTVTISLKV